MTSKTTFDVLILGGGPSGTAAGLTLLKRDDISVAVVEASDYSNYRIGESLSPGTRSLLEYLQIWEVFQEQQSLQSYGSKAAWGNANPQLMDYMFTVHGSGWSLDRVRFDEMLAQIFQTRGGKLFLQTSFQKCSLLADNRWQIQVKNKDGQAQDLTARYVIDATGRQSLFAKQLGIPRQLYDHLVGVGMIGQLTENQTISSTIHVEACEYGWWYVSPIPGNKVSVVLMSDADIVSQKKAAQLENWQALLAQMPLTNDLCKNLEFRSKPRVFAAHSSILRQLAGNNWTAVGDAVASHDPLSSTGIPHAIGSGIHGGILAANTLFAGGKMRASYQSSLYNDFMEYLKTYWQYYLLEKRWETSTFWKRRRSLISIDPHATLEKVADNTTIGTTSFIHLPTNYIQKLKQYSIKDKAVHEIIRAFAADFPQFPDQRIILGFQELVDAGEIELATALVA